jgi:hypothetical protein
MTGGKTAAPLTVANVRQESGLGGWQLQEGRLCWSAVRRPTETAREIVVGRDLDHLAVKLRAWRLTVKLRTRRDAG